MTETAATEKTVPPLLKLALEIGPLAVFFLAFTFGGRLLAIPEVFDAMAALTGPDALLGRVLPGALAVPGGTAAAGLVPAGLAGPGGLAALAPVAEGLALRSSGSGALLLATAVFMVAIGISLAVSWSMTRTLPKMAVVTAIVVAVFGTLTLWLGDGTFIKMKPTVVNGLFALILGFGLLQGRSYLKYLMAEQLPLSDEGWMIFTRRWMWFFIGMACLNELIWRTQTESFWVSFKTFGNLPLTFIFIASQYPLLKRHMLEEPAGTSGKA